MILLNKDRRMITMRHEPRLSLITMTLSEDGKEITLTGPGMDPLPIRPKQSKATNEEIISFT